ncbi:MAG: dephospho-CoA kinase [Ghiorsea sp.]
MKTRFFGLTGGIGSGKSTVAALFAKHGVPTLDLDKVGHLMLEQDIQVQQQLIQTFGKQIKTPQGINRKALAQAAFQNPENTTQLNNIMHPAIVAYEQQWQLNQTAPIAVIEASVLIESGDVGRMQDLIVVMADMKVREQRVLQRGQQTLDQFKAIKQRQCSDEQRRASATYIIENNTDIKNLEQQVQTYLNTLV